MRDETYVSTPRADAARPVPADVLEKVARLLGWAVLYRSHTGQLWHVRRVAIGAEVLTDGDLLLAILNKAAEMGERIDLSFLPNAKVWGMGSTQSPSRIRQYANTPLEAALLAFAQLEPPHDR